MQVGKKQMLEQLSFDVTEGNRYEYSSYQRAILDGIESLNDFKQVMQHEYNKFMCLYEQLINGRSHHAYYLGERHRFTLIEVEIRLAEVIELCKYVGYEFYSPNGHWFIKPIVNKLNIAQ